MRATVVVLLALLGFLSYRLADVDNQRYALMLGMCRDGLVPMVADPRCLNKVRTRSPWIMNLVAGIRG